MSNDVLVWMTIAIVCVVLIARILRSYMTLPHNEFYSSVSAADAIKRLRETPEKDVVFVVSKGFWDDDSRIDSVFAAYETFFDKKRLEIAAILGPPAFEGHWSDDDFPVYAVGQLIAVWGTGDDILYLRIQHEDKELGVEVSLLTPRSRNSNHEPESPYEGMRKYAQRGSWE